MNINNNKEIKHCLKQVDPVLESIKKAIPEQFTPQQVGAIFNLYMSLYE